MVESVEVTDKGIENKETSRDKISDSITIDEILRSEGIKLPSNPFWDVFKRFGKDELISGVINAAGTYGMEHLINSEWIKAASGPLSRRAKDVIMAGSGPVIEKAGFFPAHFWEARKEYKQTPKDKRDPLATYFKRATKGGLKSLAEDIIIHDPIYVLFMLAGLNYLPFVPATALSVASFVCAVLAVSGLEVGINELAYHKYKQALLKIGFGYEKYYEARFFIESSAKPETVIRNVRDRFKLDKILNGEGYREGEADYYDRYFNTSLPAYSNRTPKLRLRRRGDGNGNFVQTAQIVYTRVRQLKQRRNNPESYNYFPQTKEKMYYLFGNDEPMPMSIDDIQNEQIKRVLKRAQNGDSYQDVHFKRAVVFHPKSFLLSADQVYNVSNREIYLLELKVRKDTELLKGVMEYILRKFPVVQITPGKVDLVKM